MQVQSGRSVFGVTRYHTFVCSIQDVSYLQVPLGQVRGAGETRQLHIVPSQQLWHFIAAHRLQSKLQPKDFLYFECTQFVLHRHQWRWQDNAAADHYRAAAARLRGGHQVQKGHESRSPIARVRRRAHQNRQVMHRTYCWSVCLLARLCCQWSHAAPD